MYMHPGTDFGFRLLQPQSTGVLAAAACVCVLECTWFAANVRSEEISSTDLFRIEQIKIVKDRVIRERANLAHVQQKDEP
jgi:hypothetical protein